MSPKLTWDERYRAGEYKDKRAEPLLVRLVEGLTAGTALDVASGLGRNAIYLARRGWQVTAVDSSEVALAALRSAAEGLPVATVAADLEDAAYTPSADAYDLICDCLFLHRPLFDKLKIALKPGGYLLAVIPMQDDDPEIKPMRSDFLVHSGELESFLPHWTVVHSTETKQPGRRRMAELIVRKP